MLPALKFLTLLFRLGVVTLVVLVIFANLGIYTLHESLVVQIP